MTLAVLLMIGLIGVLLLGGLILGIVLIVAGGDQTGGVSSARQGWMNSHIEENEGYNKF